MTWIGLSGVVRNQSPNVCLNGSKGCVVLSSFYEDLVQLDSIHIIGVMEMVVQIIERRLQLISWPTLRVHRLHYLETDK
jgi:hypothetical protein